MRNLGVIAIVALLASCDALGGEAPQPGGPQRKASAASAQTAPVRAIDVLERAKEMFGQLPQAADSERNPITEAKVELGRALFYDPRLSKNHDIACNTCHELSQYGIDPRGDRKTSAGHKGQKGDRNSPTVYNAALHFKQFWDGRAEDIEAQAKGPVVNPIEMAMPSDAAVVDVLASIPGYREMFAAAFPGEARAVTYDNMAKAIGAFERTLITGDSPFDKFVAGEVAALDAKAVRGLDVFLEAGCTTCHGGPTLGGTTFQKLGATKPYETEDEGRFAVTKDEADKFVFKVPSLRNVAMTGPYLHDGSIGELETMVQVMAQHQTPGGELEREDADAVVAFLDSLTGTIPKDAIAKPKLPESGPSTPEPDPS